MILMKKEQKVTRNISHPSRIESEMQVFYCSLQQATCL